MGWKRLMLIGILACAGPAAAEEPGRPNVVVFYVDDMGYGDPGCYGGTLAPTPHMDSLAANGIRFTDGYVSACVCGPSRLALMTGRYQNRTGHDGNFGRPGSEPSLKDKTIAEILKQQGYRTGIVGKWHLGEGREYLPASRGFDFSVGSVGNLGEGGDKTGFYRGLELLPTLPGTPITSPYYASQASRFIDENRDRPFFLYVSFNAVHNPNVASEVVLRRFPNLKRGELNYAANLAECDDAIGTVLEKLRALQLEENTLIFCISDNGDSSPFANTEGLRGHKWTLWEGGVRVSWIVQWKAKIRPGQVLNDPVIQLDVLPTVLAAAGAPPNPELELDGINLLPRITGDAAPLRRKPMYWRFGPQFAVRDGDWKLVKAARDMEPMLVNLSEDRGEMNDRSSDKPELKRELQAAWDEWNAAMIPPLFVDRRWDGEEARKERKARKKSR